MKEYFDYHHGNLMTFEWHMFQHFDHNQDGCIELEDMKEEFHEIDINRKYFNYYTSILQVSDLFTSRQAQYVPHLILH